MCEHFYNCNILPQVLTFSEKYLLGNVNIVNISTFFMNNITKQYHEKMHMEWNIFVVKFM